MASTTYSSVDEVLAAIREPLLENLFADSQMFSDPQT